MIGTSTNSCFCQKRQDGQIVSCFFCVFCWKNFAHFSLPKNSFILVCLLLGVLDCCRCSLDVHCRSKIQEEDEPDKRICVITEFPLSNSSFASYNFLVNYVEPSQIKSLGFISNRGAFTFVDVIPTEIFTTFPNLGSLHMSTNLSELKPNDFAHALNLHTLKLNNNRVQFIRNHVFATNASATQRLNRIGDAIYPLHKLHRLLLQQNEISEIEDNSFVGLKNLYDLDLSYNRLNRIRRNTFAGLPLLSILGLNHNNIESIDDGALALPTLDLLFLRRNKLKRLSDVVFRPLSSLHSIFLDDNELEHIGRSLYGLSNVVYISLKGNRIQDVDLVGFANLPHLDRLQLTKSGFNLRTTTIEDGQDWKSPLTELTIDDNDLSNEFELEKLRIFPHLEVLNLDDNLFTDFEVRGQRTLKDILPALSLLYLRGTEIDCIDITSLARELRAKNVDVVHDCKA